MGRYLSPQSIGPLKRDFQSAQSQSSQPIWVQLAVLPNPYSHDQALLLCRHADDEWIAWIPDHGETVLHRSEFYFDFDWN